MSQNKKVNILVILVFLAAIIGAAYSYNSYISRLITKATSEDRVILQSYNNEIINRLIAEETTDKWSEIVEEYEEVSITIEDGNNEVIARTFASSWSALDARVRTPFEYHGKAYLIRTSVYMLRDAVSDARSFAQFIFVEILIAMSALWLLIFITYSVMLRHYRGLYIAIEEYEKTGKLKDIALKGYAAKVYRRFESMTKNLERQQQNQRNIIACISHDIKTPLTSIMGYAERLSKDNVSEERRARYLDTVYGKSIEIQQLVEEFDEYLDFNTTQALKLETISAKELALRVERFYQWDLEQSGVKFTINNFAGEAKISIDGSKFKRVFGNIFSNCVKHFRDGEKIINVDISCDREKVYINISDNGKGVDEEMLDIIFEPLYTSDQGRKVAGLGLAICREIIETHYGKIFARRSKMGGLEICIELEREDKKKHVF